MSSLRIGPILIAAMLLGTAPIGLRAEQSLARIDPVASTVRDLGRRAEISLRLNQPVPWRMFTRDNPARLILDFQGLSLGGVDRAAFQISDTIAAVRAGQGEPGWSRLVLELSRPMEVQSAAMTTDSEATLNVTLRQTTPDAFAATAQPPAYPVDDATQPPTGPLVIVIDPGHGGVDPGAEAGDVTEADLMLTFAEEFADVLRAAGFEVVLTRQADEFVSLEARVRKARRAGAGLFISLHADALEAGNASGTTVYTLADEAVDEATQKLTERHEAGDLLGGVDLDGTGDDLARVLMDMARTETRPRTHALADALVGAIGDEVGGLYKKPLRTADFSVLKAPDIPAVLVELGFLSNTRDLKRIKSADWRASMQAALRDGILIWKSEDALRTTLSRQ